MSKLYTEDDINEQAEKLRNMWANHLGDQLRNGLSEPGDQQTHASLRFTMGQLLGVEQLARDIAVWLKNEREET